MSPPTQPRDPESKSTAESLLTLFTLTKILNQDQNGRRISLLGTINKEPTILLLERAAFSSDAASIESLLSQLTNTTNLGANDIYRWYLSNISHADKSAQANVPDLKINLIHPCTPSHIRKYTAQQLRYVSETPELYATHIKPWIERTQRTAKRLDWIYNILDGITEQEDVVYRSSRLRENTHQDKSDSEGFLLLPDLNWDRRTVNGTHLLALVERRDLWSLRGLKKGDVPWLKRLRAEIVKAASEVASKLSGEGVDEDQFKCYVHYQPTYYHFHVHVVHVMLEAGGTQSVGKAFALEHLVSQLEHMEGNDEIGMEQVDISYHVGEESELWNMCFGEIKRGVSVSLDGE